MWSVHSHRVIQDPNQLRDNNGLPDIPCTNDSQRRVTIQTVLIHELLYLQRSMVAFRRKLGDEFILK
jgi:hypothetical protein